MGGTSRLGAASFGGRTYSVLIILGIMNYEFFL